jgi:hypothetical protein
MTTMLYVMAGRRGGIYEPETRLHMLIVPTLLIPLDSSFMVSAFKRYECFCLSV